MAETKKIMYVDMQQDILDIMTAVQYDAASRYLDLILTDSGRPYNLYLHTVRISALKPDGRRVYNNCELTDAVNGRCQAELTNQMLAVPGRLEVQIMIYGPGEAQVLQSRPFNIIVVKSLYDEDALYSVNEYGAAAILFQDVAAVRDTIYGIRDWMQSNLDMRVSTMYQDILSGVQAVQAEMASGLPVAVPTTRLVYAEGYRGTILDIAGKGYLSSLGVVDGYYSINVTIDGIVCWTAVFTTLNGVGDDQHVALNIRFNNSLKVDVLGGGLNSEVVYNRVAAYALVEV